METILWDHVRAYCEREGLSIEQLADRSGVTKQALYAAVARGMCGRRLAVKLYEASDGAIGLAALLGIEPRKGDRR